ncbi:MAG: HAMP domain-containing protein [Gammaproteobacteria bacterium]|nr:HAMP domain-containing protein [Gammaproteobacteria bacterium]
MRPASLLLRTSLTLGVSALAIALVSIAALDRFVTTPLAEQSADDEAALLVLSAQTWVELSPQARPYFELELFESHGLVVSPEVRELQPLRSDVPWMDLLALQLETRLGQPVVLLEGDDLVWAEIPMGGFLLQIGFSADRRDTEPLSVALVIFGAGAAIVLAASLLIVQRITRPLDAVASAARQFRGGAKLEPLPETGPSELVTLARSFNTMVREISELISNRTTLLAGISHDLRTPLARMRLALELLPEGTDPKLIERFQRNLAEMDALLSVSLQFARGLSGEDVTEVELKPLISRLLSDQDEAVELDWRAPRDLRLRLDSSALSRVLTNLLANASQYAGGALQLRVRRATDGVLLEVLDRGPGIPDADQTRIFQPFYRLERSRNQRTGGSGLGLAIVKQLCDAQGWRISVRSRVGGGAAFCLLLPEIV